MWGVSEAGAQGNICNVVLHLLCCRNYMNDSLRTNVFVRFQAETIACACIYLAARALQVDPDLLYTAHGTVAFL